MCADALPEIGTAEKNYPDLLAFVINVLTLHRKFNRIVIMCTLNVKMDDKVLELVKPHFSGDEAMLLWIEKQLHLILKEYAKQFERKPDDDSMRIVNQIKSLGNDPEGLLKLGSILKPSKYSAKELKDEYISDKYGV